MVDLQTEAGGVKAVFHRLFHFKTHERSFRWLRTSYHRLKRARAQVRPAASASVGGGRFFRDRCVGFLR